MLVSYYILVTRIVVHYGLSCFWNNPGISPGDKTDLCVPGVHQHILILRTCGNSDTALQAKAACDRRKISFSLLCGKIRGSAEAALNTLSVRRVSRPSSL